MDERAGADVLWDEVGVLAHAVAGALDLHDDGVVQQAVEQRGGDHGVAEQLEMPHRSIGESLRSRSLTRGIPSMGTAIQSASEALGGDRP